MNNTTENKTAKPVQQTELCHACYMGDARWPCCLEHGHKGQHSMRNVVLFGAEDAQKPTEVMHD